MPAVSKSQQQFFAIKDKECKEQGKENTKFCTMAKHFAETPTEDLPKKVGEDFANEVLEVFGLNTLTEENEELNNIPLKEKIKECNKKIYVKDKDKMIDVANILKEIQQIVNAALTNEENQKQFDAVTINRDLKMIETNIMRFNKTAIEIKNLQQRAESIYEDIAFKLNKYFDI